jgi:HlyD family secretion protein
LKRWIWVLGLGAILAAGITLGLRPQPTPVETARVSAKPLRVTIEEEGKTRLRSRYVISAPVSGYLRRLSWKAGDAIGSGAVVGRIEPPHVVALDARTEQQSTARVKAAEAAESASEARIRTLEEQVKVARVDLEHWRRERTREEALMKSGDIPSSRLDQTVTQFRRSEAAVVAAEKAVSEARSSREAVRAEIAVARAALSGPLVSANGAVVSIAAPASGRVIRVIRDSEGSVAMGEPLIEIGNANALEIVVELLSADAVKITPGTRAMLTRWGGEKALEARVRVIEPGGFTKVSALGVEEQRVRVVADIASPEGEWKALGDGYRVEAAFVLWESERVVQIASNALFRSGDGFAVYVVEGGVAQLRKVKVGHRSALASEIVEGLREGDEVILHPDETIAAGKPVVAKAS